MKSGTDYTNLDAKLESVTNEISAKNEEIGRLKEDLSEKKKEISTLEAREVHADSKSKSNITYKTIFQWCHHQRQWSVRFAFYPQNS